MHAAVPHRGEETARHQAPIVLARVEPHVDGDEVDGMARTPLEQRAEPPRRVGQVVEPACDSRQEREPGEGQRQGEREQDLPDNTSSVMTFVIQRR